MIIWERFRKNIFDNNLVCRGDKILLAVSGGADSMVMASLFAMLRKSIHIELVIVNFNHNLRKESVKESKIVKKFADSLKIECILKELKTKEYAKENNISTETAGRQLRYAELEKTAKEYKCNKIATAHNMNDNAETVLMWMLRGTGTEGISGIPVTRKINKNLTIIRPILSVSRDMIDAYAKEKEIKFCTDKTNFKCDYTRNKIRNIVLPYIKREFNPNFIKTMDRLSEVATEENEYLNKITKEAFDRISLNNSDTLNIQLDLKKFSLIA